jgi:hypothetical protein
MSKSNPPISQLKLDLEYAIQKRNKPLIKDLLYNQFPYPENYVQLKNPNLTKDGDLKLKQKQKLDYCIELIKLNSSPMSQQTSFKKIRFPTHVAEYLYRSKSTGWATGLCSIKAQNTKRPSNDHIFPRMDMAKFFLTQSSSSNFNFIHRYRHLYGLTIKVASQENKDISKSLIQFYNDFSFDPCIMAPYILPVIQNCYERNGIQLFYKGKDLIFFPNLRKYIHALFL